MNSVGKRELLEIKKYPNRRYYDATRSRHVTLQEVYDAIVEGHDVVIMDSKTGEDITNLVLVQMILERDQPKLDVFPASILHLMIRSNRHAVRTFVDRYFGPFMQLFSTSHRQFDAYLRHTLGGNVVSPLEWASSMMGVMGSARSDPVSDPTDSVEPPPPDSTNDDAGEMNELREHLAQITERLDSLTQKKSAARNSISE